MQDEQRTTLNNMEGERISEFNALKSTLVLTVKLLHWKPLRVAALNLFRRNHNLDVNESDIAMAHIIPRQTQTPTRQQQEPAVIVRFRDRNVRNCVIQNRRKLKGTSRSIVEDLTALNVKCLNRVKNNAVVQKTWTWWDNSCRDNFGSTYRPTHQTIPNSWRSYHHCHSVLKLNTSILYFGHSIYCSFLYFLIKHWEFIAKIILVYFPLSHLYILLDCTRYVRRYDDKGF